MSAPPKGADKRDRKRNARQAERKTTEIKFLDVPEVNCSIIITHIVFYHFFCKDCELFGRKITRLS